MKKDEFLEKLTQIGTTEDEAARRSMITELSEAAGTTFDELDTLTDAKAKWEEERKTLQAYNMDLYLQVQGQKTNPKQETGEEKKPLQYADLFDENGILKN